MSSPITVSSLTTLRPTDLARLLSTPATASRITVIDVRDSDHIGGHIKGSSWVPAHELEARIPELLRLHRDKDKIVFHCMLSQQRGPRAALQFARAQRAKEEKEAREAEKEGREMVTEKKWPDICVLEGGFGGWQARFGQDETLTESYVKDLWE